MNAPAAYTHSYNSLKERLFGLPKLGVGVLYNPSLTTFLQTDLAALDYVAIIPDTFWIDHGIGQKARYTELEDAVKVLDQIVPYRPLIGHSVGLSIGSADLFDTEHVAQIAAWQQRYRFPWHSDHLSFVRMGGTNGHDYNAGLAISVPYDKEVLDLISTRVDYVQQAINAPFLLENNVYYVDIPGQDMTEPEFLSRLAAQTNCGLLLDVHNVYTNARNHGFNPLSFIDQLDLTQVIEIHIAGGNEFAGMYTDSHAGPCPTAVWELLEYVMARAEHVCGITFEFHESYYPLLKAEGIRAQLQMARAMWDRCHR